MIITIMMTSIAKVVEKHLLENHIIALALYDDSSSVVYMIVWFCRVL